MRRPRNNGTRGITNQQPELFVSFNFRIFDAFGKPGRAAGVAGRIGVGRLASGGASRNAVIGIPIISPGLTYVLSVLVFEKWVFRHARVRHWVHFLVVPPIPGVVSLRYPC